MTRPASAFASAPAASVPATSRPLARSLTPCLLSAWLAVAGQAGAQVPDPAPAPAPPAKPGAQTIEITGARQTETEERRRSTAAKIIVGRDEIERFGDSSLGEMLKRLPGVTLDGRAGRGGNIRMRGLGGGYTQILLDGERVQGGLSLDSIDPEQIERIEILRAPTAETGARAIAGTINIITREGFRKRLNDLKLSARAENGQGGSNLNWTRDDKLSETLTYNLSLSGWYGASSDERRTDTRSATLDMSEAARSQNHWQGLHANGRLQWRLDGGDLFTLMPSLMLGNNRSDSQAALDLRQGSGPEAPDFASSLSASHSEYRLARLNAQWRQTLAQGARLEWRGGVGQSNNDSHALRDERDGAGQRLRQVDDSTQSTERNAHLNAKLSVLLEGDHSLVSGLELDAARREERHLTLQDGVAQLPGFGGDFSARTQRVAAYAQDEWSLTPNWAAHAGLRWEGMLTQGQDTQGQTPENRSSVWTPLLHAVWKPDPKARDQIRISLTRSYRSPGLNQLLGQPTLSVRYPVPGDNTPTSPDRVGNPALRPELATGVDLAFEHYLPEGGMLSVNLFQRRIRDLMRTLTTRETVAWSATPRWVARPTNLGDATTQGVELEAKFRLPDVWAEAPQIDLRANASVFRSRVDGVAGPDNRLDQQPSGTANLGGDWKVSGLPLTLGANLNWTPGYTTRLAQEQWLIQGRKRVLDAYALWQVSPWARLRLSGANLAPEDALSTSENHGETAANTVRTYLNWRLQLELKL